VWLGFGGVTESFGEHRRDVLGEPFEALAVLFGVVGAVFWRKGAVAAVSHAYALRHLFTS